MANLFDGTYTHDGTIYYGFYYGIGKPVVRIGDKHAGICHGFYVYGVYTEGSLDTLANSIEIVRVGDEAVCNCPVCSGVGYAAEGSNTFLANTLKMHRVGDKVIYPGGEGLALTGSPDTFAGD